MAGNNLIFPTRESVVSDITAGNGKIASLFYSVFYFKRNVTRDLSCIKPQRPSVSCWWVMAKTLSTVFGEMYILLKTVKY
jgi:hypothetical protein